LGVSITFKLKSCINRFFAILYHGYNSFSPVAPPDNDIVAIVSPALSFLGLFNTTIYSLKYGPKSSFNKILPTFKYSAFNALIICFILKPSLFEAAKKALCKATFFILLPDN